MNSENFRDTPQKSVVFAQSQIYGSVYDFIAKVKAENPVIDILVNNAGTILRAPGRSRAFAPDLGAHPRRTLGGSFGHRRSVRVSLLAGLGLHQRHRSAGGRRLAREIVRPAFA